MRGRTYAQVLVARDEAHKVEAVNVGQRDGVLWVSVRLRCVPRAAERTMRPRAGSPAARRGARQCPSRPKECGGELGRTGVGDQFTRGVDPASAVAQEEEDAAAAFVLGSTSSHGQAAPPKKLQGSAPADWHVEVVQRGAAPPLPPHGARISGPGPIGSPTAATPPHCRTRTTARRARRPRRWCGQSRACPAARRHARAPPWRSRCARRGS